MPQTFLLFSEMHVLSERSAAIIIFENRRESPKEAKECQGDGTTSFSPTESRLGGRGGAGLGERGRERWKGGDRGRETKERESA